MSAPVFASENAIAKASVTARSSGMALEEPRKLNVGRNRSAGAVLDEQLMREALEALGKVADRLLEADFDYMYERGVQENSSGVSELVTQARAAATKLEERLLKE